MLRFAAMAYSKDRKQINIFPYKDDHQTLKRRAKAIGLTMAKYCLLMSLHGKIPKQHLPK